MAEKRHPIFKFASFNIDALLLLAEALRRKACSCSCDRTQRPASGALNWAIVLHFSDGVEWIFRSPRRTSITRLSADSAGLLIASEAATLRYIRTHTSIPVPEVFQYSTSSSNNIGVPFILMSKASGQSLSAYNWPSYTLEAPSKWPNSLLPLTSEGKGKIMLQLGAIMAQLSQLRFDKIGSLFENGDGYAIKECLSTGHIWCGRDSLAIDRGPFDKANDYYESLLYANFMHAKELRMDAHIFVAPVPDPDEYSSWADYTSATDRWNDFVMIDDKINNGQNRLDYCIASQLVQSITPSLSSQTYPSGFPLRHPDISVNNLFVDEDMNITCVIDWAFSSTVPFVELLATPGMPNPRTIPDHSLVAQYRAGFISDETVSWEDAEKAWHFQRLVSMDSLQDYVHFERLYALICKETSPNIPSLFQDARQQASEELLGVLQCHGSSSDRRVQEYFSRKTKTNREAVARKLTVMMELNKAFVADRRLWHWIKDAVD